jgi:hypothetical protein
MSEASAPWDDEGIEKYWGIEHEAYVTSMRIERGKSVYEHLQKAFYWFKERYKSNPIFMARLEASQKEVEELKKELKRWQDDHMRLRSLAGEMAGL